MFFLILKFTNFSIFQCLFLVKSDFFVDSNLVSSELEQNFRNCVFQNDDFLVFIVGFYLKKKLSTCN